MAAPRWRSVVDGHLEPTTDLDRALDGAQDDHRWLLVDLDDPAEIEDWGRRISAHPAAAAVWSDGDRAQLRRFADTTVVVTPRLQWGEPGDGSRGLVVTGAVRLLITPRGVIGAGVAGDTDLFDLVSESGQAGARDPMSVAYHVLDEVLDDWFELSDDLATRIDEIDAHTVGNDDDHPSRTAYHVKRDLIEFRRRVTPLGVSLHRVALTTGSGNGDDAAHGLVHEVAARHVQLLGRLQSDGELLDSIVQAALAQVSVRQNEDMRRISAWVAIVAVPTFLAGVWGMNFTHMPELTQPWGYAAALGLMAAVMIILYVVFKRHRWL